jgi:hypothetical protein
MELNKIHLIRTPDGLIGLLRLRLSETKRLVRSRLAETGHPRIRELLRPALPRLSLLPWLTLLSLLARLSLLPLLSLLAWLGRLKDGDELPLVVVLPRVVDHHRLRLTVRGDADDAGAALRSRRSGESGRASLTGTLLPLQRLSCWLLTRTLLPLLPLLPLLTW